MKRLLLILFVLSTSIIPVHAQVPGLTEAMIGGVVGSIAANSASSKKAHKGAAWSQDIYRSHLTDHLNKDQVSDDQRVFSASTKSIIWVGESQFLFSPRPIKALWTSPQGKNIETKVVRFNREIYKATLPNKGDFFFGHQGKWQVKILTATGQEVDQQNFYIGRADMQEEVKDVLEAQKILDLSKEDAVVVFSKREVVVHDQYGSLERLTKRMMVLSDKGKEFVEVFIPFVSGVDRLMVNYAYTIKPNGEIVEAKEYGIQTFAKSYPDYSAFKFFGMTMPSLQKGSIVEYQLLISSPLPKVKGMFFDMYSPQYLLPVIQSTYTLNVPKEMNLKYLALNTEVENQENLLAKNDRKIYRFSRSLLASIKPEPAMPSPREVLGEVIISTAKSWDDIAQWWHDLIKDKSHVTSEIQTRVDELTKDLVDNREKIRRIYAEVSENVRYVGLNFGSNIYEPASAADVFKNKYGDCKDQTMLLLAMLKAGGIKAHTALARSGFSLEVQKDMPTVNEFNHVIVVAEDAGKKYFLDPTLKKYSFGILPAWLENRYIMHVKEGISSFEFLPLSDSTINRTVTHINLDLNAKLNVMGDVYIQWHGQENGNIREYLYQFNSNKQKDEFVDAVLKGIYPYALRDRYEFVSEEDVDKPLGLKIMFHMDNWLLDAGGGSFLLHMYGGEVRIPDFLAKDRVYPVRLNGLSQQAVRVVVKFSNPFDVDLPENFNLSNDYVASHVRYLYKDSVLQLDQSLSNLKVDVPLDQIDLLRESWEKIAQANRKGVLLKPREIKNPEKVADNALINAVVKGTEEDENKRKALGLVKVKAKALGYQPEKMSIEFCEVYFDHKFPHQSLKSSIKKSMEMKELYAVYLSFSDDLESLRGLVVFVDKKNLSIADVLIL